MRGPRGYDGAKKVVGRKRVLMVDAQGHILALSVVPANVQDRDTLPALDAGKEQLAEPAPGAPGWGLHGRTLPGVVSLARHAPSRRREGAGPEGLRRPRAALAGRAHPRMVQPLGWVAARARRAPRRRDRTPLLRCLPDRSQRSQQARVRSTNQTGSQAAQGRPDADGRRTGGRSARGVPRLAPPAAPRPP
ncbi:transposase [Methylobacterium aquaticum]|uniref:transposase n=1 Tax=Methylobacterium aquaticum TaxID=270351 RepID=UPI001FD9198F|nr:transposase [Methylobacterium aquaticum]